MASIPTIYRSELETRAPRGLAASITTWLGAVAARADRAIAKELRIRRDTRALMAMSDHVLKDIGLTHLEISHAARYGRD